MPGPFEQRHRFRLLRVLTALLMVLSLSGVLHAAEETVETVVHVAQTGHGAHASEHPEGHANRGGEHYCFGAMHHCGCCQSAHAAQIGSIVLPFGVSQRVCCGLVDDDLTLDGIRSRIDRPPSA